MANSPTPLEAAARAAWKHRNDDSIAWETMEPGRQAFEVQIQAAALLAAIEALPNELVWNGQDGPGQFWQRRLPKSLLLKEFGLGDQPNG